MQKNVPKLRFSGFRGEWALNTLSKVGEIITGTTPPTAKREYYGGQFMFVSPADINDNRYVHGTNVRVSDKGLHYGRKINKSSVMTVCIGSTIGKIAQAGDTAITNQQINTLEVNENNSSDFVYYRLLHISKKIKLLAGIQAVPLLNKSDFSNIKSYFPSLVEQQKIASFLSKVDEWTTNLKKQKEELEKYKKGMMQKIFSQKVRFKDENGKEFPKWEIKKLGDVYDITSSKRVFKSQWKREGIPFYRAREIVKMNADGFVKNELFISKDMFQKYKTKFGAPKIGDLLVTGVGTIGVPYLVEESFDFYFKDGNIIWLRSKDRTNSKYTYYCFQTPQIQKQISDFAAVTTVSTYTIDGAKKTIILQPSHNEQQKIAEFLTSLDKVIESKQKQIGLVENWKKV